MGDLASLQAAREKLDDLVASFSAMPPELVELLRAGATARGLLHEVEELAGGAPPRPTASPGEAARLGARMEALGIAEDAKRALVGAAILEGLAVHAVIGAGSRSEIISFARLVVDAMNEVLLPMHQRATAKATLRLVAAPLELPPPPPAPPVRDSCTPYATAYSPGERAEPTTENTDVLGGGSQQSATTRSTTEGDRS